MAHLTGKSVYHSLLDRINAFPAGAPPSELVEKILAVLFTPDEAALVARLPIRSFRASKAAALWGMDVAKARDICRKLADKGLLVDVERDGKAEYTLPPPMAGFFEFALMRVRPDIDQKALSELFYQYLNVEEDFIKDLFSFETQLGRAYVNEEALSTGPSLQVLDFDRVSFLVQEASAAAVGICSCRHKMSHVGRACTNRQDNCITLNSAARSLIKHGIARKISKAEAMEIFRDARSSRPIRGKCQGRGQLHLQLLQMLLRRNDCRSPLRLASSGSCNRLPAGGNIRNVPQLREMPFFLSGRCHFTGAPTRCPPARPGAKPAHRPRRLSRLWGLCRPLSRAGAPAPAQERQDLDPGQHDPPRGSASHRKGNPAKPDLRLPGPCEPPGDGGHPRGHFAIASREADHGQQADEIGVSRLASGKTSCVQIPTNGETNKYGDDG